MDEFRTALELATQAELEELTDLLFRPKFNPLDYLNRNDRIDRSHYDRAAWLDELDQRFRFLAADGITVLQGKTDRVSYRTILLQICRYLKLPLQPPAQSRLSTTDLEAEIFLYLLNRQLQQSPGTPFNPKLSVTLGAAIGAQVAKRGLVTVARSGAMRSALAVMGPALWTWFLADLGWQSIATNYGRIIPMVFAIAQIRLTRG